MTVARKKKPSKKLDTASSQASDIMAMSPFVMGSRLAGMSGKTPLGAASDMHGFAMEKSMTALESGTALWMEMARLSMNAGFGNPSTPENAAKQLVAAALKPVARRVRENHAAKTGKTK